MQKYGNKFMLDTLGFQALVYLAGVLSYYLVLLDHPAGLWDEHSSRNSGILEGVIIGGVWVYSKVSRHLSRLRAWKTVALDQVCSL